MVARTKKLAESSVPSSEMMRVFYLSKNNQLLSSSHEIEQRYNRHGHHDQCNSDKYI